MPLDQEYRGSYYRMRNRATVVTRILTQEGIVGESYVGDEDKTLGEISAIILDEVAPRLIGENAFGYERCWERAYPVTYDQLRDRRIGLVAVAAVDFALWDAIGKALRVPLWQLWGGHHDVVPVNIIGGYYGRDLAGIRDEVAEWLDMGFHGCKFKVGGMTPREDAERVRAAREAAGDDFVITIDANQGYTLQQALELCDRLRDLDIRWFEEPCIWSNDKRDMREVRARGGIPVCAGQSEYSAEGCRDLMEAGAIDVCNFDASWCGGYTSWRRMGCGGAPLQRPARPSRRAADRDPSPGQPIQRHLRRGIPPRPRSDLVEPHPQPLEPHRWDDLRAQGARTRMGAGRRVHLPLPGAAVATANRMEGIAI